MSAIPPSEAEVRMLQAELHELAIEHRDLDTVIEHLATHPPEDELLLRRLKKRKLILKDRMRQIESRLIPDMPA